MPPNLFVSITPGCTFLKTCAVQNRILPVPLLDRKHRLLQLFFFFQRQLLGFLLLLLFLSVREQVHLFVFRLFPD